MAFKGIMSALDKLVPASLQPLWNHPAGLKTIFFWGPAFKWGLVVAGLNDQIYRDVSTISIPQTFALAATGLIWARYAMVIIPKNYSLGSVNAFLFIQQSVQIARAIRYQNSLK